MSVPASRTYPGEKHTYMPWIAPSVGRMEDNAVRIGKRLVDRELERTWPGGSKICICLADAAGVVTY
jgi:hypothetical protein